MPTNELELVLREYFKILELESVDLETLLANILFAEMAGKYTHGLSRAHNIRKALMTNPGLIARVGSDDISFLQRENMLFVDGMKHIGTRTFSDALNYAIKMMAKHDDIIGFVNNTGPFSGFIGAYAYTAMKNNYVFLAMVDSPSGVYPFGAKREMWGTDTITFGFPDNKNPVLVDLTLAEKSLGDIYLSDLLGMNEGGCSKQIKPISGYKGSALILMSKVVAGMMARGRSLEFGERTAGAFFLLIKKDILPSRGWMSNSLEMVTRELDMEGGRIPGRNTIFKIDRSIKNQKVSVLRPVYDLIRSEVLEFNNV